MNAPLKNNGCRTLGKGLRPRYGGNMGLHEGRSSSGVEHVLGKDGAGGSIPPCGTT